MSDPTSPADPAALGAWLDARGLLPGAGDPEVVALGEGHSNLTFLVRRGGGELVLRRPPRGPLLPTAHDVVREARVMALLASGGFAQVPAVRGVVDDDSVLGAPFYVMDRSPGVVVREALPPFLADDAAARRAVGLDLATTLGEIHRVDWRPFVDAGIGKPSGYLERQLRRWVGQREGIQAAVAAAGGTARELPDYDAVRDWLRAHLPAESEPAVVHGDYKLDNVIVEPTGPRISAVVDWEMATVGDPLMDLGTALCYWVELADPPELRAFAFGPTALPGSYTRREFAEHYARITGRSLAHLPFYSAFGLYKTAVVAQQIYLRYVRGHSKDARFAMMIMGVRALADQAERVIAGC